MTRQKGGFLTFICSLIPGAGELYMGFKKQGISIMAMFWGIISFSSITGFAWITFVLPIIWAYSFFNVHNLKGMPEDVFAAQKDEYAFQFGYVIEHRKELLEKYRGIIAGVMIFLGLCIVWNTFGYVLYYIFPVHLMDAVFAASHTLQNVVLAAILIGIGAYLAVNKEKWHAFLNEK